MSLPSGLYAASVTPLRQNGRCDFEALASHCQDLLARGCQGVVLFGTTGEGPSFTLTERKEAVERVISLGVDPAKIIVGATFSALDDVVALCNFATELGTLALLIAPPFFFKNVPEDGVVNFYQQLARLASQRLKIILYHIPQYSGVSLTLDIVKSLVRENPATFVGLKESEGNFAFTQTLLKTVPDFSVYVGNESHIHEAMKLGAKGAISGLANCFPEEILKLFNTQHSFIDNIKNSLNEYPIFPAIKSLVAMQKGNSFLPMRAPLMPLTELQREKLQMAIQSVYQSGLY